MGFIFSKRNPGVYDQPQHGQTVPQNQDKTRASDRPPRIPVRCVNKIQSPPPPPPPSKTPTKNCNRTLLKNVRSNHVYDAPESSSKPKVRADKNYESNYDTDISFRKGDFLQLIDDREVDGWCYVRNLTTLKEGFVPTGWVTMMTIDDVESQTFFYKGMDREEAEYRLTEGEMEIGTFLLRPSGDDYALSLLCQNEFYETEVRHYKVRVAERGFCYIEADSNRKPFSNITELIQYYTENPGLRCKLSSPLPANIQLNILAVTFSELKLGSKLGSGNFGSVYAGTLHENEQVAVKSLKARGSMTVGEFRKEAEAMHKLRHQNLVSLLGISENGGKIYIIMERMSTDLLKLLQQDIDNKISFKDLLDMAIQVADGMCYMVRKRFVHRDLRAANVLVGDENITKIADFGMARLLDQYYEHEDSFKDNKVSGSVLPYKWTAPEAIRQKGFTFKSDVWSFGILLYEMMTHGQEPYAGMSNQDALRWVERGNRLEKPTSRHCPVTLYNIMKSCWLTNSGERPDFAGIKETLLEIEAKG